MQAFAELLQKLPSDRLSFALRSLPYHLTGSEQLARLHDLLTDFRFLEAKVNELDIQALLADLDLVPVKDAVLTRLRRALLQASHLLDACETLSDVASTLH